MAAAHAGTSTAFDTVHGAGPDGTMDGIDDFAFRNRFTATDDAAVTRIFSDKGFLVRIEHHAEAGLGRTAFFIIGLSRSTRFRYDEVHQLFGNGRRRRKARRLDAGSMEQTRRLFRRSDDKVARIGNGADTGKFGNRSTDWDIGD